MLLIVNAPLLLFVRVTSFAALVEPRARVPKLKLAGEITAWARPVPESVAACGLLFALSVMVTEALRVPVAVGLKVRVMVHVDLAGTLVPQVLVCEKSPLFVPLMTTPVTLRVVLLLLVRVRLLAPLTAPITVCPKVKLLADKVT